MNISVTVWDFIGTGIFQSDIRKKSQAQKVMKIRRDAADLFPNERRMDRQTCRS